MVDDDVDEVEEGEIVGDEEEKVEDSFPENFAGDVEGKLDEMGEMIGDDSVSVQPGINVVPGNCDLEHDDNQPPRVDFSLRECNEKPREEDTESANNISFGDLKKLIPNGCFGPFNSNNTIHSLRSPNAKVGLGREVGLSNMGDHEVGLSNMGDHLETLGQNIDFSGSYTKRRKLRNNSRSFDSCPPPPPIFEPDDHVIATQEINLNKSPTNPNISNSPLETAVFSTPEIIRTARIGQAIGFDIEADNEILVEAMGEVGVCNGNR
ncbi:hypothetical protein L1887_38033 [Cichorium endivia]|nr:hypothetical protein L1887_38033 [Cichorium endivia]